MDIPEGSTTVTLSKAFVVYETVDDRATRGRLVGVFPIRRDADVYAMGRGWYGGTGKVLPVDVLELGGEIFILENVKKVSQIGVDLIADHDHRVEAAKAKLTAEELELLGIK
jgi:hypothetical protein